ncbi:uncharacterized protein BXZ73DRAFT_99691 [Epithele typhae]|uniref:uncharacterized protein n=1 Tax=Epithele typhae TaxID=378194 RepID=UPI002007AA46|nr:uncharacterized protein BXZ73DRAFT_99691 [Epithele typhae]KAH9939016.1 hypothetical protein BXZ73DRAFT_99691 [Epithele typhae]
MFAFVALAFTLLVTVASASTLPKRQAGTQVWQSPFTGTITAPAADTAVEPGTPFAFAYTRNNWCQSSYSPFTVYATQGEAPPSFANVTTDGRLAEGTYVQEMGTFVVSNFGLPLNGGIAPPSTMTVTAAPTEGQQTYVVVLQEYDSCPGGIAKEFSLTSVPIALSDA